MSNTSTKQRVTQLMEWLETRSIKRKNTVKTDVKRGINTKSVSYGDSSKMNREQTRPTRKSYGNN